MSLKEKNRTQRDGVRGWDKRWGEGEGGQSES